MDVDETRVTVRLPTQWVSMIDSFGRNRSDIIRNAIRDYLKKRFRMDRESAPTFRFALESQPLSEIDDLLDQIISHCFIKKVPEIPTIFAQDLIANVKSQLLARTANFKIMQFFLEKTPILFIKLLTVGIAMRKVKSAKKITVHVPVHIDAMVMWDIPQYVKEVVTTAYGMDGEEFLKKFDTHKIFYDAIYNSGIFVIRKVNTKVGDMDGKIIGEETHDVIVDISGEYREIPDLPFLIYYDPYEIYSAVFETEELFLFDESADMIVEKLISPEEHEFFIDLKIMRKVWYDSAFGCTRIREFHGLADVEKNIQRLMDQGFLKKDGERLCFISWPYLPTQTFDIPPS